MLTDGPSILVAETIGTGLLIILGDGVVAGVLLAKSKAQNAGWIVITTGWALAVAVGVYAIGGLTGAHLNPAVTIGFAAIGLTAWDLVPYYLGGEFLGAFIGAIIVWLHYLPHWAETEDPGLKLAVFSTGPAIRSTAANLISEIIGTFMLVLGVLAITSNELGSWLRGAPRGLPGVGHRPLAGWHHRLRHQPRARPEPAHRARHPADLRQGRVGLGLQLGPGRRPDHRRRPGRVRLRVPVQSLPAGLAP